MRSQFWLNRNLYWLAILSSCFAIGEASAATGSPSFNYQGRILNADGTAAYSDVVDLTLGIYDPTGTCLLYEETQTSIDLVTSGGLFSVQVGSAVGNSKRSSNDPGKTMTTVFANAGSQIRVSGTNCTSGYTPAASDARILRVTVTPYSSGAATTLTPDLAIHSVPFAMVAETLQGLDPSNFIQATGNVTQTTMGALTGGSDVGSSLHHHDSLYVKIGSSSSNSSFGLSTSSTLGLGSFTSGQQTNLISGLTPSDAGKTWYNSTNNQVYYWNGSTAHQMAVAGSGTGPISYDNITGAIGISSSPTFTGMTLSGLNSAGIVRTNSSGALSTSALSSSELITALGFTPANKAGDTFSSTVTVNPGTNVAGLVVKGSPSQTLDLTQWQNSSSSVLAKMDSAGKLTVTNFTMTGGTPGANKVSPQMRAEMHPGKQQRSVVEESAA